MCYHLPCRCGFGLLMYGFGSKRKLLEDFATAELRDGAAVVVNGYVSNVNIKHVMICNFSNIFLDWFRSYVGNVKLCSH